MTEDDLYDLLSTLADGRVYPYVVPLGSDGLPAVSTPYVIFSIPTDVAGDVFCGQQSRHCAFRLMYGLKRMTKPERYARRPARLQVLSPVEVTKILATTRQPIFIGQPSK